MEFKDYRNIHEMLTDTVSSYPDSPAFRWILEDERFESVTWQEFYAEVKAVAKSLLAAGINKDDKVNIISYSCYRWVLCDLAITAIGACTVGIYHSNLPADCEYIINHSDAVLVFAQNADMLAKMEAIRDRIPAVRQVVLFEGAGKADDDWVVSFEQFVATGKDIDDARFDAAAAAVSPSDPAGIVYTSGTTGVPKGVVLTHDNITFTAQSVYGCADIEPEDECFLFLPLAHVFARTCTYTTVLAGRATTFARSIETVVDDIKIARPHYFASVPRIFEKIYAKVIGGAEAKGGAALKIFNWARDVGMQVSNCRLEKRPIPALTALKYKLATRLVFSKLQAALGGQLRWCISGAAPLNPDIAQFFHAAGILILEGIGMTENTSFSNINRFDNYRFGWVGPTGPGIEQKIADNGEIMCRGRNVMLGYYKMPDETAANIEPDGWLHTGDLGEIDNEGFLRVTGRKKELIITAGGKNIAPARIEGILGTSKYINQILVIGDQRKFLSALVSLDHENISAYADEQGIAYQTVADLEQNPQIQTLIEEETARYNQNLASFETIKKVSIVPEFTIENGMLTPTLKLKKNIISENYQEQIDTMYTA